METVNANPADWLRLLDQAWAFADKNLLAWTALIQLGLLAVLLLLSWLLWRPIRPRTRVWLERHTAAGSVLTPLIQAAAGMIWPALFTLLTALAAAAIHALGHPVHLLHMAVSLVLAWIVIRLSTSLIADRFWAGVVATLVWMAAALNVLGLLAPTMHFLDGLSVSLGDVKVSVLGILKAAVVLVLALEAAMVLTRIVEGRVDRSTLSPAVRVLAVKGARLGFYAVAGLVALASMGLNLSSLAFLGGALGVGVGFGLQKVFSNLVSGFILLLDRSIKPGDIIEIGGTVGTIQTLQARYALLRSLDGKEILVPNEDLISGHVVNWTRSDRRVRVGVPVGVSYDADLRLAMKLMEEAAASIPRALKEPAPRCLLRGFGDSSVNLEVGLWITDPENGLWSVQSEVFLAVWDRFKDHGIEIPFPQQDLHIKDLRIGDLPPGFPPKGQA